jgi:hypothetical protein|tara:strand:- start:1125 stop:1790 length:666 start_codon:yes stop_codon:yes gene_type:complete
MKKLITSGCSYTQYRYKTWADHLSKYFDEFKNLGEAGSGQKFSYIAITDYINLNKNKDLSNHTFIIQWSSLLRHDLIKVRSTYQHLGQIDNNENFNKEYINKYFSVEGNAIELVNYIDHLNLLSDKYKFKLYMFYMFEPWIDYFAGEPTGYSLPILRKKTIEFLSSQSCKILKHYASKEYWINPSLERFSLDNEMRKKGDDDHPTTEQHKKYANMILKKIL